MKTVFDKLPRHDEIGIEEIWNGWRIASGDYPGIIEKLVVLEIWGDMVWDAIRPVLKKAGEAH